MGRLFGTDGVRGVAVTELTCETAMQIGRAAAQVLASQKNHRAKILVGMDSRVSGEILESALVAGICSAGADAVILGIVPTPAVAVLIKKYGADAGIVFSASHSSSEYNGIKIFASDGFSIDDKTEKGIEELVLDFPQFIKLKKGNELGHIYYEKDGLWDYIRYILKKVDIDYHGMKIAVDCANGAASECAGKIFRGLGATVVTINDNPDGVNINLDCGTENINCLQHTVIDEHCDVGLAFDGDAGRCIAVDEKGGIINGDKLMAIFAAYMQANRMLKSNACVVTKMTNFGFYKFARTMGIVTATTKVGNKYVLEEMKSGNYNLGGEQSGNIIFLDDETTSDGLLTGTKLLSVMKKSGKKASEIGGIMEAYPQVLLSAVITPEQKGLWEKDTAVCNAIKEYSEKLGSQGRIFVRESGTEPLVRVMIEGHRTGIITDYAHRICSLIESTGNNQI